MAWNARKFLKWTLWTIVGLVVLAVLFLATMQYLAKEIQKRYPLFGAYSISDDPNSVTFNYNNGKHVFVVPKGYLWAKPDWSGGEQEFTFHMTYPDFEPVTTKNKHLYPWNKRVSGVFSKEEPTIKSQYGFYLKNNPEMLPTKEELENGWDRYDWFLGNKRNGHYYIRVDDSGAYHRLECWYTELKRNPYCTGAFDYDDDFQISYRFPLYDWHSWEDIEQKILEKFRTFEQLRVDRN